MISRLAFVIAFGGLCCAQQLNRANVTTLFDFELGANPNTSAPRGWGGAPTSTLFADNQTVHSGKWAARLERGPASEGMFSTITIGIPADAAGKTIEYRGYLKLENVSQYVGLWLREDGESGSLAFDNMQSRKVNGSGRLEAILHSTSASTEREANCFRRADGGDGQALGGRFGIAGGWKAHRAGSCQRNSPNDSGPRSRIRWRIEDYVYGAEQDADR